ncbi:MAG: ATP-binding protein, partial [Candidatus Angelobacter sp.]
TTRQHGTGLGLAIVQSVVSDHHGRVTVSSRQGVVSTFAVEIPAWEEAGEQQKAMTGAG